MEKTMTGRRKTPGAELAQQIITQYQPKSVEDMENALKDIFAPMFEAILQGEMENIAFDYGVSKSTIWQPLKTIYF